MEMNIPEDIKDEAHDSKKYDDHAKKMPSRKKLFKNLARDERKHGRLLKSIPAREKALKKAKS